MSDEVDIVIDWSTEPPPTYANGAQVTGSPREFALFFSDFAGIQGRGGVSPEQMPPARVVASVRMTPDVFFQFTAALASNWNRYLNRYGDPSVCGPKYKLVGRGTFQLEGLEPPGMDDE